MANVNWDDFTPVDPAVTPAPSQPAKPENVNWSDYTPVKPLSAIETAKAIGKQILDVPEHLAGAAAAAYQGTDVPVGDTPSISEALIQHSADLSRRRAQETQPGIKTAIPGVDTSDIQSLGPSLGFSGVGMGAGAGAGLATAAGVAATGVGVPAAPAAGYAAGAAASGTAAYRMAANQFMHQIIDKYRGDGMNDAQIQAKMQTPEVRDAINKYGLGEAIPEALSNAIGFKILSAPIKTAFGKAFGENLATRLANKTGALVAEELPSEVTTQMVQNNAQVEAGLGGDERSYISPADWLQSAKEVAPSVLLQTALTAGAGHAIAHAAGVNEKPAPAGGPLERAAQAGGVVPPEIPGEHNVSQPIIAPPVPAESGGTQPDLGAGSVENRVQQPGGDIAGEPVAGAGQGEPVLPAAAFGSDAVAPVNVEPIDTSAQSVDETANIRQEGMPESSSDGTENVKQASLDDSAHAAATSPTNDLPEPTDAQKEAGNYKVGRVNVGGLNISVENPQGSTRSGTDRDGKAWQVEMQDHYGYIKGVKARAPDKEHVDVYVRPGTAENFAGDVYVVNQVHPDTGKFDEPKVLIGYSNQQEAEAAYRSNYSPDWKGMGSVAAVPMSRFKEMLQDPDAFMHPIGEQQSVQEAQAKPEPAGAQSNVDQELEVAPQQAAEPVKAAPDAVESKEQPIPPVAPEPAAAPSAKELPSSGKGRPDLRPLIEDLIRNKRFAEQSGLDPERALDRAKQIMRGQREPTKMDAGWFRSKANAHDKAKDKANADTLRALADAIMQKPAAQQEQEQPDSAPLEQQQREEREARMQFERSDRARKMIAERNKLNPQRDDLMTAIAKLGGLKKDDTISEFGLDPADLGRFRSGIKPSFSNGKNALTTDGMREALRQYGYPVGETVRDFGDILDAAIRGGEIQTDEGVERDIQSRIEAYEEQFSGQPDAVHEAVNEFDDWLDSTGTVMTDDDVEALFNGPNENRQEGQGGDRQDQQPAAEAADGGDRDDQATPADQTPRAEGQQDLLGDNTAGRQAVADAAREKDHKRNSGDSNTEDFTLTGSNRAADQAAARGARDLFDKASPSAAKKQPHELTLDEFVEQQKDFWRAKDLDINQYADEFTPAALAQSHLDFIESALEEGKTVPKNVLEGHDIDPKEYPLAYELKTGNKPEPPEKPVSKPDNETPSASTPLSIFDNAMDEYHNGTANVDDYKAAFKYVLDHEKEIIDYLGTLTKKQLFERGDYSLEDRYKNEKKERVVRALYGDMVGEFLLPGETGMRSYSHSYGGDKYSNIKQQVDAITQESLSKAMERRQEVIKDNAAKKSEVLKGIADPQTLDDFNNLMRSKMAEGMTLVEARKTLTPEQRERYDDMAATKTRGDRGARKNEQKTEVRAAVHTTTGDIIETKHTKTGEDLFVVKAAERVERDVYNQWNTTAKRLGGWYSSFRGNGAVPGFQFKTRENAEAFLKYLGGDVDQAKEAIQTRRDEFADDRSQTAAQRLTEMADKLEERADESLGQERKANTARRARFAASAEAAANADKALAKTMRNIAQGIDAGSVKYLDQVRQKVQVEMLQGMVRTANDELLRDRYKSYREQEEHKHDRPTKEAADFVQFPNYTAYRSDLASLGRSLLDTEGTKKIGQRVMSVADDVTDAYLKFARENLYKVSRYSVNGREPAVFPNKQEAEKVIARSGFNGKAIVLPFKRGQNMIILSPSEAMNLNLWNGDHDKRITLAADLGAEIVEKLGKINRNRSIINVPWQFENAYDKRKRLAAMGIETPAELRAAVREFIGLQEAPQAPDKIKQMERAMIGRRNDGLDFFPTPASIADEMIETAGLTESMRVLEPSAGMGHIADQIREAGVEPDVVEFSGDRRELLQAKGYNIVGHDFMDVTDGDYDRIIMNPPFGDRRDAAHVQHAYDLLKPGGRLVAIMGEGVFFGQDKKAQAFREWLENVGGTDEKLEEGTFNDSSLPVNTGVNARMVVIDKPAEAPVFRRGTSSGMDPALVKLAVGSLKTRWKNAPDVVVVKDMNDSRIRKAVRDENERQLSQGASGQPEGFYDNGKVYIVSSEMHSARDVQRVLFHEALGHYGLRGVFGNDLNGVLDQVYLNRRNDVLAKAKSYGLDISKQADRRIAAEEVLAELAQTHPELNFVKRAIAAIRVWLRQHGFDIQMTDDEIVRELIEPARQFVQRGNQFEGLRGMVAAFDRGEGDQTETEAFKRWFGDSKVVDAEGKPLVVYHGTGASFDAFQKKQSGDIGGYYAAPYTDGASPFTTMREGSPNVMPLYMAIKNPASYKDLADVKRKLKAQYGEDWTPGQVTEALQNQGFDGYADENEVVAFRPEQIKSAIGNRGTFDPENPSILFSRANRTPSKQVGDTFVTAAMEYLARDPELFQRPSTEVKDIYGIAEEIDPGYRVVRLGPSMTKEKKADRAWEVFVPESGVRAGMIMTTADEVWVDVSRLQSGVDSGSAIYDIAAAYAHNNGKVLIGDPLGLSRMAFFRRTENMLSSALKYGTTRHLRPALEQEMPAEKFIGHESEFGKSVRPIDWIEGNDAHNIKELIYTSWKSAIDNAPELKDVIYDPATKQFKYSDGRSFTAEDSERIAAELAAKPNNPYRAGSATQKRAALFNTFLRRDGREGRGELLDSLVAQLSRDGLAPSLRGIFYSRSKVDQTTTTEFKAPEESALDKFIYHLQDKHIDLKRVTEEIRKSSGEIADEINAYQKEELYHGRSAKLVKDFLDSELTPLINEMRLRSVSMADFEEYLWARHAEERNIQIAKINEDLPDGGSGMTTQAARDYLAGLTREQRTKYEALAARIDAMTAGSRQVLVDYGLESADTLAAWQGAYQHYVPLMRDDMDHGFSQGTGQGFSVRGNSSKRATGSARAVVDILANIAQQRERNIVRGEKNRVATALVGLAEANPNKEFWKVDVPPTITTVQKGGTAYRVLYHGSLVEEFASQAAADKFIEWNGKATEPDSYEIEVVPAKERVVDQVDPLYKSRDNVVVARIPDANGQIMERSVVFSPDNARAMRMAASIKNLDSDTLGDVLSTSANITRYFAAVNTQYNPIFGVINLVRDVQTAALNLTSTPLAGKQAEVASNVLSALKGIYSDIRAHRAGASPSSEWAELFEEFQREGGQTGYRDIYANARERAEAIEKSLDPAWWAKSKIGKFLTFNGTLQPAEQVLADSVVKPIFNWLSDYNEAMENAVRLSAYKVARDQGLSKPQAASLAKNLTVNFNRKGEAARQIGALYAFFNASVQGTARIAETLKGRTGRRIIYGGMMLGALQALMLAGFDPDEPPDWERDRNIIIPLGDGRYFKVAMPLGFNALPAFGRIVTEWMMDGFTDTNKRITHIIDMLMDVTNPIGNAGLSLQTIAPTVLDPLAALAENKDFTGKPIAKEDFNSLDPTPGFTRARDTASAAGKVISQAMNWMTGGNDYKPGAISPTPDQIDYLIGQVTGGVGRELMKVEQTITSAVTGEELPDYKVPLFGRFVGNVNGAAQQGSAFYDNVRTLNIMENEIKGRRKDGTAKEFVQENPEARLIALSKASYNNVAKLRKVRRQLLDRNAPPEQIHAIDDRITGVMKNLNDRMRLVRQQASE